jgi:uncharacterized integral membrane protein
MQIFLLISLVIAVLGIVFALQNAIPVTLSFLVWRIDSSLALVLLIALGAGVLVSFLATLPSLLKGGWTVSGQKRELKRLGAQVADYKDQLLKSQAQLAQKEKAEIEPEANASE